MQRIDGRWYLVEFLRHAEAAASTGTLAATTRPAIADAHTPAAAK
jgi:hypothetical protein